jgi:HlyD family secretion protein
VANEAHVKALKCGADYWNRWRNHLLAEQPDFSDADLSAINLSEANLMGANFSKANLSSTDLKGALLSCANLSNAYLSEANLSEANLSQANLTKADLSFANLTDAILSKTVLNSALLVETILVNADLSSANLNHANLKKANLENANLVKAILIEAVLDNANLKTCNLSQAIITEDDLRKANSAYTGLTHNKTFSTNVHETALEDFFYEDNSPNSTAKGSNKFFRSKLQRFGLFLALGSLSFISIVALVIIFSALKNSESNIYYSSIGYPALKRLVKQPIKVNTSMVQDRQMDKGIAAPGESIALQKVEVLPLVSGKIEKVYVVEGQWVQKGTPLLQIEQSFFEKKVGSAQNNLTIAQAELSKLLKAYSNNLPDTSSFDKNNLKLSSGKEELKTSPKIHQQKISEYESSVKISEDILKITEKKVLQFRKLYESGAISLLDLNNIEEKYKTRQKEVLLAQQQLYQEKLDFVDNQEALITKEGDIQVARLELKNRKLDLQKAIEDLNNTTIYASMDGLVSKVKASAGDVADNKFSLITLNNNIVFKAYVDQVQINTVRIGNTATVRLVSYPGKTFQGKIFQLNPTIETSSNSRAGTNRQYTYSIWIKINEPKMNSGLQGYAQVNKTESKLTIPESALTHLSSGEGMVMTIKNNRTVIKKVKVGRKFNDQRELLQGLGLGEKVILYPRALKSGDLVKPQA